jgi:predicted outer membrane repeat protein
MKGLFFVILAVTLLSCEPAPEGTGFFYDETLVAGGGSDGTGGGGSDGIPALPDDTAGFYVNGEYKWTKTLPEYFDWITDNAVSGGIYKIVLGEDVESMPIRLSYPRVTVMLKGAGAARTLSLNQNGTLFTVGSGVTLVMEKNIKLQGRRTYNYNAVVSVSGEFTMNDGEIFGNYDRAVEVNHDGIFNMNGGKITGNGRRGVYSAGRFNMNGGEISDNGGGGIELDYGNFSMTGGKITGNWVTGNYLDYYGGGNYKSGNVSQCVISGGEISGNTAKSEGGGIYSYALLIITGGEIKNNTASAGGGIYVDGTVNMSGGIVSGNNATGSGGGIYAEAFEKTSLGGIVYGSDAYPTLRNTSGNGEGHAVYVPSPYTSTPYLAKKRNLTVNANEVLDSDKRTGWE